MQPEDAVENSPQAGFGFFHCYPQRTGPCATTVSPSSVAIPYNGLPAVDMSTTESVSNIRSLIHSPSWIATARNLRGEEAQGLIDLIDRVSGIWLPFPNAPWRLRTELGAQAITLPDLDEKLRRQCLHLLYKVCKSCEMLPASYTLQQESICAGKIRSYGGFADVSEGEYLERRVAIKHLRFGTKDTFNNIFKVSRL